MIKGLVSVITPMYNSGSFVGETIESVLSQTYEHWEMIVIDDGSTDIGPGIVEGYMARDKRIKLYKQQNSGSGAARNNGIRRAEGQYIALLDADDIWMNNFLERQIALLNEKNAELVYSSHLRIDENGKECLMPFIAPSKVDYRSLLKNCSISCLTGLYDTKTFGKFYLREDLKSLRDDYVYWLQIIKHVKVAYGNKEPLASYRILSSSVSRKKLKVILPQFRVYYKIERLGMIRSSYYLLNWAIRSYFKYRK